MYTLYGREGTGSFAPQVLLEEIGVAYDLIRVATREKENLQPWFLKINPLGQIPVLQLADGEIITESAAIMLYLADRHPDAHLAPGADAPHRGRFLRFMVFAAANLYMTLLRIHYPERQAGSEAAISDALKLARARHDTEWQIIDDALGSGPFMLGETFSALDPYLFMLLSWHEDPMALLERRRSLRLFIDACLRRPSLSKVWPAHNVYGNITI